VDIFENLGAPAPARPRTVENGVIRALSVSQLKTAHRCLLAWWYEKVQRLPGRVFKAQQVGIEVHAQLEEYLKTGVDALGPIARPGKKYLPLPGEGLLVEHRFDGQEKGAEFNPATALLRAGGVPLDGFIDVVNLRLLEGGRAYPDAEEVDEPGTIEALDHKTTANIAKWGAKREQLADMAHPDGHAIQMVGYAEWARLRFPAARRVRLTHVDYQTSTPKAHRVSILLDVDQIQILWLTVNRLAETMVAAAKLTDANNIPYNTKACGAFGGCPYKAVCPSSALPRTLKGTTMPTSILDDIGFGPAAPAPTPAAPAVPAPQNLTYEQFQALVKAGLIQAPAAPVAAPAPAPVAASVAAPVAAPKLQITEVQDDPRCTDCGAALNAANGSKNASGWKHIGCTAKAAPVAALVAPIAAPVAPTPAPVATPAPVEDAPKKTRAKKTETAEPKAEAKVEAKVEESASRVELFIDCTPGGSTNRLEDYIAQKVKAIEERYAVADIRIGGPRLENGAESPIAYGKWKGVLAYIVKSQPPRGRSVHGEQRWRARAGGDRGPDPGLAARGRRSRSVI
jgi:hypothetical protein